MIYFACLQCGRSVRVADGFAGKKGRCPFCKAVVQIPAVPQGAASGSDSDRAVPPPPHKAEDASAGEEPDLKLVAAGDPRHQTDRLDALLAEAAAEEDQAPAPTPRQLYRAAAPAKKKLSSNLLIGAAVVGGVVLVGVVVAAFHFGGSGSDGPEPPANRPTPRQTNRRPPQRDPGPASHRPPAVRPEPAVQPEPAIQPPAPRQSLPGPPDGEKGANYNLAGNVAAAAGAAPAGAFFMLHVDFAAMTGGLAKVPRGAEGIASTIAVSRFWHGLKERIAQGTMPTSATLFLVDQYDPVRALLGPFYGVMPGQTERDPAAGPWSLVGADAAAPHFLLRLTGPGSKRCTDLLLSKAEAVTGAALASGSLVSHQKLRLVPAEMLGGTEMLLGTVQTIENTGRPASNQQHVRRLRGYLNKIETDKGAVAGCVVLGGLKRLNSALGAKEPALVALAPNAVLVFSLNPGGEANILIARASPPTFDQIRRVAGEMSVREDTINMSVAVTGSGREGMDLLAKLMPGVSKLLLEVFRRPGPSAEPQPQPQPQPQPHPQPQPSPEPSEPSQTEKTVPFICGNPQCSTGGEKFDMPKSKVTDEFEGMPLTCPHCNQHTAVPAVRCRHCKKWTSATLSRCMHCRERPR